jgi:hypothetical protein
MFDEREALVVEVRPWDVHGSGFVDVTVTFADRRVETARLGRESAPTDLQPGDHVVVRLAMNTIVEVLRPIVGPA